MMLKPLHSICLLVLLGVGLVSCQDEQPDNPTPQATQLVIDTSLNYTPNLYYIQPEYIQGVVNDTAYYDIDEDGVYDFAKYTESTSNGNQSFYGTYFINLHPDSMIFSVEYPYPSHPDEMRVTDHLNGDTINNSLLWETCSSFPIFTIETSGPMEMFYIWGESPTGKIYIGFKKIKNNVPKLGWARAVGTGLGPWVMEK